MRRERGLDADAFDDSAVFFFGSLCIQEKIEFGSNFEKRERIRRLCILILVTERCQEYKDDGVEKGEGGKYTQLWCVRP